MHFFFDDTATTDIYTLSLHDALPISKALTTMYLAFALLALQLGRVRDLSIADGKRLVEGLQKLPEQIATILEQDRKSTRLNSSHANISYAVLCLKKKYTSISNTSTAE